MKLVDLVERDIEQLAALGMLNMGAPNSHTRNSHQRALGTLRFAGMATALHGETDNAEATKRGFGGLARGGRVWRDRDVSEAMNG